MYGTINYQLQEACMKKVKYTSRKVESPSPEPSSTRGRIIYAAVGAFLELGYTNVSMLEIATRARVSNRDLYAEFENKRALLAHCITFRAQKMKPPNGLPAIENDRSLAAALAMFGENLLQELTDPEVLLMYYLAIVESWRAPEVAKIVDECGRQATERALKELIEQAQARELLVKGDAGDMVDEYLALLLRNLLFRLILRVIPRPPRAELKRRAIAATDAFLALHRPS
jgi:AcrR family transcriptional regulator